MSKGEITISEIRCKGCGLCVHYCPRQCIAMSSDKFTAGGYLLAVMERAEDCTGCGVCGWLCPDQAIEVYRLVESKG
jgi:2-oxoglutarate ferredoxin oxidoreductase subunit delta